MNKNETIIFIGNGYDLACNYATSYADFIKSEHFTNLKDNNLCIYINEQNYIQNWVDIETELYNYSRRLIENNKKDTATTAEFKREYESLCNALQGYLSDIHTTRNRTDMSKDIKELQRIWNVENDIIKIIEFNYTPFLRLNFQGTITDAAKYHKLHGYANIGYEMNKNQIVLGIDESMQVDESHEFLYKSNSDNIKIETVKQIILSAEKYVFFGCSFGKTDYWYYEKILNQKNKIYEIYDIIDKDVIYGRIRSICGSITDFKSDNSLTIYNTSSLTELLKIKKAEYLK